MCLSQWDYPLPPRWRPHLGISGLKDDPRSPAGNVRLCSAVHGLSSRIYGMPWRQGPVRRDTVQCVQSIGENFNDILLRSVIITEI